MKRDHIVLNFDSTKVTTLHPCIFDMWMWLLPSNFMVKVTLKTHLLCKDPDNE